MPGVAIFMEDTFRSIVLLLLLVLLAQIVHILGYPRIWNQFTYIGVPQYIGIHYHVSGYPNRWEIYWGTPRYGNVFIYAGAYPYIVTHSHIHFGGRGCGNVSYASVHYIRQHGSTWLKRLGKHYTA
jgi:hypothetical protein